MSRRSGTAAGTKAVGRMQGPPSGGLQMALGWGAELCSGMPDMGGLPRSPQELCATAQYRAHSVFVH